MSDVNKDEYIYLKELQRNTEINIMRADKGGAIVILKKEEYLQKMLNILASDEYVLLNKDPTPNIERKMYKILFKLKDSFEDKIRTHLTPHHFNITYIYGLPKIHKEEVPLQLIVSSRFGPIYELSKFLLEIISPLTDKCTYAIKNADYFVNMIRNFDIAKDDVMVSFDVVNLFLSVPVKITLNIVRKVLENDSTLLDRMNLPVNSILELLEVCLGSVYFWFEDNFYSQKEGLPMGSSLSAALANIFMDWFEGKVFENTVKLLKSERVFFDKFKFEKHTQKR